jgi:hypothetical protein
MENYDNRVAILMITQFARVRHLLHSLFRGFLKFVLVKLE